MQPIIFYKALADDTRLNILLLLADGNELCVCDLMTALNDSQPKISRHLALLRQTGMLQHRRQGQWVHYQLHQALPVWARQVLQQTLQAAPAKVLAVLKNQRNNTANCCS